MKKSLLTLVMALVASVMAYAQVTTASMSGKVTDPSGEVIGANIVVVHTPSGTTYGTITNAMGVYSISGMKAGGPYKVTVSYIGDQTKVLEGLNLALGETTTLDVWLQEAADQLEEVVVLGTGSKFSAAKTGATTNISLNQITSLPTVSRSVEDIARLSPYGGNGMSFGGADGRSSNFTVDGANFNNNFGLNDNLPGGGMPISMDAFEEIQVVVAPYDVRQSNFVGGGVNAVTKSGTNTFRGSAYTYQQMHSFRSTEVAHTKVERPDNEKHIYGVTFGGPIIKNKLFFFGSYETSIAPSEVITWKATGKQDAASMQSRVNPSDLQTVSDFVNSKYGYNTGSYTSFPADETNKKILARIDWNITNNHRLALRYNYTHNEYWNAPNGSSMDGGTRASANRVSAYGFSYANTCYSMENNVHSFSFDLNSRFGDKIQNQLLATFTKSEDVRGTNSSEFPMIDILQNDYKDDGSIKTLYPYISLGYELFTYNNGVHNNTITAKDDVTLNLGNHKVIAGLSYEHQMADNAYLRNGTGYYRYNSLDDFLNGKNPVVFALTYGYNGETAPASRVQFDQFAAYVMDSWNINKKLKVDLGLRADLLKFNEDDIMTNNALLALDYNGRHIDSGKWPEAHVQISPRFGFSYDIFGDRSLTVRGGTGLFQGRLPLVFLTNMPQYSNMIQYSYSTSKAADIAKLVNSDGTVETDRAKMIERLGLPTTIKPEEGKLGSTITGTDSKFKMPVVWKSSIGFDYNLPTDMRQTVSVEYTYNETVYGLKIENWNLKTPQEMGAQQFAGADNRYIYPAKYNSKSDKVTYTSGVPAYVLTNTKKGYGQILSVQYKANPTDNLSLTASYTYTDAKEISGMPGSAASSVWQGLYSVNGPDQSGLHRSQYATPHRVLATVNYTLRNRKFKGSDSHFTLIYEGKTGGYGNYYYSNDMNGDGLAYDLLYIPKTKDELNFKSEDDREAFWAFVNQDKYMKHHKGQYAEAYAVSTPFVSRFDFRFAQDFTINTRKSNHHKLTLSLDLKNAANLFCSRWGVYKTMSPSNYGKILTYEGKTADNEPIFSIYRDKTTGEAPTKSFEYNKTYSQGWYFQLGAKYTFN